MSFKVPEERRVTKGPMASTSAYGNNGQFTLKFQNRSKRSLLLCQASDGAGWNHVSVSTIGQKGRLPTHDEMEYVRNQFWEDTDWVIEFHPPANEYVNNAPCLHLWQPNNQPFPTPDPILVGLRK